MPEKKNWQRRPPQTGKNSSKSPFGIGERMQKKISYRNVVEKTGVKNFDVIKNKDDFYGMWIYLWKQETVSGS